jgi:hypothetical protein
VIKRKAVTAILASIALLMLTSPAYAPLPSREYEDDPYLYKYGRAQLPRTLDEAIKATIDDPRLRNTQMGVRKWQAADPQGQRLEDDHRAEIIAASPQNLGAKVARLLAAAIGSLFDPLAVLGYLLAGILLRPFWTALVGAMIWAALMEVVASMLADTLRYTYELGDLIMPRLIGALIFTSVVFWVVKLMRERSVGSHSKSPYEGR